MAKKPIKAAKKKAAKKVVKKAAPKKAVKKAAKPVAKKTVKKVAKKVAKKVVKKAAKKVVPAKKQLALPRSSTPSKATPAKAVVKGRMPEKTTKTVASAVPAVFDAYGFNKMADYQKRLFLATACVKFMASGLQVRKGDYIKSPSLDRSLTKIGMETDLKNMLENASDVSCCGAGILLYGDILLRGDYPVYRNADLSKIGMKDISDRLNYFKEKDLKIIETAFEGKWAFADDDKAGIPAIAFGLKFTDDRRRMSAILNNIIENNGDFKP